MYEGERGEDVEGEGEGRSLFGALNTSVILSSLSPSPSPNGHPNKMLFTVPVY